MNLTLAVDDQVAQEARRVAESLGKSLNQMVREYLESLSRGDSTERDIAEFIELSKSGGGQRRGWKFNREELYDRT